MCGRFTMTVPAQKAAEAFGLEDVPDLQPRFNIAPTQPVPTVLTVVAGEPRKFRLMRWGLIPHWAKDTKAGAKMINARAETVAQKASFRTALRKRRCVILADGFYEWGADEGGGKQPYYIRMKDRKLFAMAGLWETWQGPEGPVESCTIVTTEANAVLQPFHHRMPVILAGAGLVTWLDPDIEDAPTLAPLLVPYPAEEMTAYPVGRTVNSPRHDGPACIEPAE